MRGPTNNNSNIHRAEPQMRESPDLDQAMRSQTNNPKMIHSSTS